MRKASRDNLIDTTDPLRAMKAEKLGLEIGFRKGQLLDRNEVVMGFVARHQNLIFNLDHLCRELPAAIVGKGVEKIQEILAEWRTRTMRDQSEIPEALRLPPDAKKALIKILQKLTSK